MDPNTGEITSFDETIRHANNKKIKSRPSKVRIEWAEDQPVTNLDEATIARAVLKRLKRAIRDGSVGTETLELRANNIREKLNNYHR